jgi:hypothetical protein
VKGIVRRIEGAYGKAPFFEETMPLVHDIMAFANPNVATFNTYIVRQIAQWLGLETRMALSSELAADVKLQNEERVMHICRTVGATQYVNPIGGAKLYSRVNFGNHGIALAFLEPNIRPYRQFAYPHVPNLSIIDALMFNGRDGVGRMLTHFSLKVANYDVDAGPCVAECRVPDRR